MRHYLSTFRRVFPGKHFVFASLTLVAGVFSLVYAFAVSRGLFLHGHIEALDHAITNAVLHQRGDLRSSVFLFFTYLGNAEIIISIAAFLILILFLARKIRAIWFLLITLSLGQLSSSAFKLLLSRSRPNNAIALIEQGGHSFPSGHALGAFVFYGILGYFLFLVAKKDWQRMLIIFTTLATIGLIGLSRLYLGVHWFSDVIAGWLMGATLLIVFIVFFEHRKQLFPARYRAPWVSQRTLRIVILLSIVIELLFFISFYRNNPIKQKPSLSPYLGTAPSAIQAF